MKQKSENLKAFPRFLGILVVASLIGGVLGGLSGVAGYFWKDHTAFGAAFAHLLGAASPWAMVACAAVLLGLGLYQYRKSDTAFHGWDGEDEDVMQRAEERLSWALLLDSLTVIVSFFFFNAGTAKLPQSSDGNTITLLVIFLVVIALATLLQQKTVDLTKKMNPEKRGSVYDMKFQERWWESCDEAERRQLGQASYKAYVTVSRFCPYCCGVLLLWYMVCHYCILPSAVVLVIWAVLSVSYTREAIRLGRRGATDEEVLEAAKAAQCDEFIRKLPQGYQTVIGENGSTLSGGERQRISIARALLKDAPVVLLDEATASLDVENESAGQTALSRLRQGKTVLVIAHRMRTVAGADHIVVLENGHVAQQGTPAELMEQGGLYRRMVELQSENAQWRLG